MFWYLFWILVSYESPAVHPTITAEERCFIEESIGESAKLLGPAEVSDPIHNHTPNLWIWLRKKNITAKNA